MSDQYYSLRSEWPRTEMPPSWIDALIDGFEDALDATYKSEVDSFLTQANVGKWIIASDYSMNRTEFACDAMAFVLIPYNSSMFPPDKIARHLPFDFKDCKSVIGSAYIQYLRRANFFGFVFLLDRANPIFKERGKAELALRNSLAMMEAWPNAGESQNADTIRKVRLCLKESGKKNFARKLSDVTMLSALGAAVALIATKKRQVNGILWCPDRDNMNGIWEGLSSGLFHQNFHSVLHRRHMNEKYIHGLGVDNNSSGKMDMDPYIRLADFLATPAAAMFRLPGYESGFEKAEQVTREVFTDNPNLIVHTLSFPVVNNVVKTQFNYVQLSKTPFPTSNQQI